MPKKALLGALWFGIGGLLAGYVWTVLEFPFIVALQWVFGWVMMTRAYGRVVAVRAGLLGGAVFTVAFLVAMFLAISDDSPLPIAGWVASTASAAVAGAVVGYYLGRAKGAVDLAIGAGIGMLAGTVLVNLALRPLVGSAVDVEGQAQYLFFALAQGIVGAFAGAGIGGAMANMERNSQPFRQLSGGDSAEVGR